MGEKFKIIYRTSQNIGIINVFVESLLLSVLCLAGNHSPPQLPGMPSDTVLIFGPPLGAVQLLNWS